MTSRVVKVEVFITFDDEQPPAHGGWEAMADQPEGRVTLPAGEPPAAKEKTGPGRGNPGHKHKRGNCGKCGRDVSITWLNKDGICRFCMGTMPKWQGRLKNVKAITMPDSLPDTDHATPLPGTVAHLLDAIKKESPDKCFIVGDVMAWLDVDVNKATALCRKLQNIGGLILVEENYGHLTKWRTPDGQ